MIPPAPFLYKVVMLQTKVAVSFSRSSAERLLGSVNFQSWGYRNGSCFSQQDGKTQMIDFCAFLYISLPARDVCKRYLFSSTSRSWEGAEGRLVLTYSGYI